MVFSRSLILSTAAASLIAMASGCSGPDNPKIVDAPPPPPPPKEAATENLPKNKYMNNDKYKEGMEKMKRAAEGRQ